MDRAPERERRSCAVLYALSQGPQERLWFGAPFIFWGAAVVQALASDIERVPCKGRCRPSAPRSTHAPVLDAVCRPVRRTIHRRPARIRGARARSNLCCARFSLLIATAALFAATAKADTTQAAERNGTIVFVVPLRGGRFYSSHDVLAEANQKLGTDHQLDTADRVCELSVADRAALAAAKAAGFLDFELLDDRLVLRLPNRESDDARRRHRRRLGSLLGIDLNEWPRDKGLHLTSDFDPGRRTIVLVHGLESNVDKLRRYVDSCRARDIQAIAFDYPNDGPLAWSGDRLRSSLDKLADQHPTFRAAIVAHSMGGLVARHCLEAAEDRQPKYVTDLFLVGTPNHGSALARGGDVVELAGEVIPGLWNGKRSTLRDGLGEASDDLHPGSLFLRRLNARPRPAGVRYHSAIGRKGFLRDEQVRDVERELQDIFDRRSVAAETRSHVLQMLRSDELRTGRGDGVVAVASARLQGAASERVFDVNHLELLSLPGARPEEHEVFRWIVATLATSTAEE
ncbi:MAG: alpha/beta fold hydrolase [Planctomycetia bacterium]|nr:alpha/beta fold hydrolase [Planctomycetia bacterium]